MAKLTDDPPSRAFKVSRDKQAAIVKTKPKAIAQAAPAQAGVRSELSPFMQGMGMSGSLKELLKNELRPIPVNQLLGITPRGDLEPLGHEIPGDPGCIPTTSAAYACSKGALQFLVANVLRVEDILPIQVAGFVRFENGLGVHTIPLGITNNNRESLPEDFLVPDTQALIVTEVSPFAALVNPGLPGAHIEIDPLSLVGQVAFYLVADNGVHILSTRTITQGEIASGNEIVNEHGHGTHPPITDTARTSVKAAYRVIHKPFPGYPSIVGVRIRGYMVDQQLLDDALDRSYRAGG